MTRLDRFKDSFTGGTLQPAWKINVHDVNFGGGTPGGLVVAQQSGHLEFDFADGGPSLRTVAVYSGDNAFDDWQPGLAGPWDFTNSEIVWENVSFPDWSYEFPDHLSSGGAVMGVGLLLYNVDTALGDDWVVRWEATWNNDVDVVNLEVLARDPDAHRITIPPAPLTPAYIGDYEHIGGTSSGQSTPEEMYRWCRLRNADGTLFFETSRDGVLWSFVHGAYAMSPEMRNAMQTCGVGFYAFRTHGFGAGTWAVDNLNLSSPPSVGPSTLEKRWYAFGFDGAGQAGTGEYGSQTFGLTDIPLPRPVLFPADVDIVAVSVGSNQGAGLSADGHIYVWGDASIPGSLDATKGFFGDQLLPDNVVSAGDPEGAGSAFAVPVLLGYDDAATVVQVAVGFSALFWLKSDNTVWGVGMNLNGEFGTSSSGEYFGSPAQLSVGVDVASLAACIEQAGLFAVGANGHCYFAGDDFYAMDGLAVGGLVTGVDRHQLSFVEIPGVTGVTSMSASGVTALAIGDAGTVWQWGIDMTSSPGSLFTNPPTPLIVPTQLSGGVGSTVSVPFATMSRPQLHPWPTFLGPPNTSLTVTGAVTIEPPLSIGTGNPDDPPAFSGWNTQALDPAAHTLPFGMGRVGDVTLETPGVTWDKPYHGLVCDRTEIVPWYVGLDYAGPVPIWYKPVAWPDDAHAISGALPIGDVTVSGAWWIHEANQRERPCDVTYLRHSFWIPAGSLSGATLQIAGVDFLREVWLNGSLLYSNTDDYNLAFDDYGIQSISASGLVAGAWNLLAVKIQHHANILETVVGPDMGSAIDYPITWDPCAAKLHEIIFYSEQPPAGSSLFKFHMLTPHEAKLRYNDPYGNDPYILYDLFGTWPLYVLIGAVRSDLASLRLDEAATLAQIAALPATYATLLAQLQAARAQKVAAIAQLTAFVADMDAQIAALPALEATTLAARLAALQFDKDSTQTAIDNLYIVVAQLQDQILQASISVGDLNNSIADVLNAITQLVTLMSIAQAMANLMGGNPGVQAMINTGLQLAAAQINFLYSLIPQLQQAINDVPLRVIALQAQQAVYVAQIATLQLHIVAVDAAMLALPATNAADFAARLVVLNGYRTSALGTITQLTADLVTLDAQIAGLPADQAADLARLNAHLADVQAQIAADQASIDLYTSGPDLTTVPPRRQIAFHREQLQPDYPVDSLPTDYSLTNTYAGALVAPPELNTFGVKLSDVWLYQDRHPLCDPMSPTTYDFDVLLWDVAWTGPVHQLGGVTFRVDATLEVPVLSDIVQCYVTGGSGTAYLLDGSGQVWGFGSGFDFALGQDNDTDHYGAPILIDVGGKPVRKLMAGSTDTYSMLAITYDRELWGWGQDVQFGHGDQVTIPGGVPGVDLTYDHPVAVRIHPTVLGSRKVYDVALMAGNVVISLVDRVPNSRGYAFGEIIG